MTEASTSEAVTLDLPNGMRIHLPSPAMIRDASNIILEIFHQQAYSHPGFAIQPADVVVDVGAHVGVFAHWAAPQLPQGRLICIEPTSSADCLASSLASNNLRNTTVHQVALGRPSSTLEMFEGPGTACMNRATAFRLSPLITFDIARAEKRGVISPSHKRIVPCWSLAELLSLEQLEAVDLLKIDCEGSEYEVFEHTTDADLRRFKRIMMEFHVFHPSHDWRSLVKRLQQCGFDVHVEKPWLHYFIHRTGMLWATRND